MRASAPALAVLTYHRIGDPAAGPPGLMSATRRTFERQMAWLAASGRAVSLGDVLRARDGDAPLPRRAVLVTFDDAYTDFAADAWPVLERHGVPAVLFVPTAFPGEPGRTFWWDRLYAAVREARGELATPVGTLAVRSDSERRRAYRLMREHIKRLPHDEAMALVDAIAPRAPDLAPRVLSWPELRRLAGAGVVLGAHSRTHPLLSRISPQRVAEEIAGSVDDLRRETGRAPAAFAFPGGDVPAGAADALRAAGVRVAFGTARGVNALDGADWLGLARINVGRRTGALTVRAQLAAGRRPTTPRSGPRPAEATPRIAYVMSRFPKLSETFVLAEILALERRRVRVDVYPLLRERAAVVHPDAERVVAVARYEPFLSPAVAASQLAWLARRPDAYLRAWRDVLAETWGSPNFFAGALGIFPKVAHMARRMEADGVTHVHCHFANHPAVAGLIVRRLTGIPFSFTAHGSDLHKDRRMLPRKVAEAAFVATVSHDNRRLILAECGDGAAAKVHVVRAGVDTTLFAPPDARPPGGDTLRIACVGTLHEVKGQAHLVEACRLLTRDGVAVTCRLVGDGPDRRDLEAAIAAAGLAGRVVLAGPLTRAAVADELRRADVLVAPSVPTREGRREGIPVVLMEAMSSGLPVVASAISGIPELVEDGVSGLLVPPGDAAAIAAALRRLAADPPLRDRLGRAARRRVVSGFDLERSVAELARRFGAEVAA